MSTPAEVRVPEGHQERSSSSLDDLAALPPAAPDLSAPLPQWVTDAHLRWLETGEGDPWGGYFS